jgi:predicted acylesterase/phospholipase RssA
MINIMKQRNSKKPIQHIVLSGGAYLGLYELGALKHLNNADFYNMENIKTIHGTSIGGLLGSILCLNIDWETIYEYFIKRPWIKMIQITPNMLFDVIPNKGLLGHSFFENAMIPLLKSVDIEKNITLKEFYEKTQKELYLYSVDINTYKTIQLSYKTHPDLELIQAIHMTCSLPYMFQPVWYENTYYIDGGLINNYPTDICYKMICDEIDKIYNYDCKSEGQKNIDISNFETDSENISREKKLFNNKVKDKDKDKDKDKGDKDENILELINSIKEEEKDTILGMRFHFEDDCDTLKESSNIFEYGYFLYRKMICTVRNSKDKPIINNELVIPSNPINMKEGYEVLICDEKRKKYIEDGENYAKLFLNYKQKN